MQILYVSPDGDDSDRIDDDPGESGAERSEYSACCFAYAIDRVKFDFLQLSVSVL